MTPVAVWRSGATSITSPLTEMVRYHTADGTLDAGCLCAAGADLTRERVIQRADRVEICRSTSRLSWQPLNHTSNAVARPVS
jgi:hypothetical protein